MPLSKIISLCDQNISSQSPSLQEIENLSHVLADQYRALTVDSPEHIPYGRYLAHQDPDDRYHLEMHIFSSDYEGSIHCHRTWGLFWVISGSLMFTDYLEADGAFIPAKAGILLPGSAASFYPPYADWHKVKTPPSDEQTLSLHIYGHGYDQETGEYVAEDGDVKSGKRGAFKDNELFLPYVKPA